MSWRGKQRLGVSWIGPVGLGEARHGMNIHSCLISYNRLPLTQQAIESYLRTVTGSWSLIVVDNGSTDGAADWLMDWVHAEDTPDGCSAIFLGENKYPGYACNAGWAEAPQGTSLLHRGDNDFTYLDGWENHVRMQFTANPELGQLGLRTDQEELHNRHNVGGNCVIRKTLWDDGLRYDERPWPKIAKKVPGYTEDSFLSPQVRKMGWEWDRVTVPCIRPISAEDPDDPYYVQTWKDRGIG